MNTVEIRQISIWRTFETGRVRTSTEVALCDRFSTSDPPTTDRPTCFHLSRSSCTTTTTSRTTFEHRTSRRHGFDYLIPTTRPPPRLTAYNSLQIHKTVSINICGKKNWLRRCASSSVSSLCRRRRFIAE
ncbi:hypothetical protein Y032_0003g1263 [Ancylostoma ceylanicum]|uniref:Uncharacterized protein n=1 Tax=Ancylostoma ceylanicum TaxID=53326 RepID=A0A016VXR9_9BILA|nr:hypothetical protein Y032_0003g1263 [Ancylostoma ceylanicum]